MLVKPHNKDEPHQSNGGECGDDLIRPAGDKPKFKHETDGKERKKTKPNTDP